MSVHVCVGAGMCYQGLLQPKWLSFNASPPYEGLHGSRLLCSQGHAVRVLCFVLFFQLLYVIVDIVDCLFVVDGVFVYV